MGQALYRKYRSKSLAEIVGQEHITKTLDQAVKTNRISHAYFFTGPRGVGKTSIARILAHEINGLEYADDAQHVDIIEIDAASHGLTDDVRDLREKAFIAPVSAKYKVYIIDEVHMMSTPAFNALLKILEEPPEHVVFILATTNAQKVPETIVSRTQRFQFRPIESEKVIAHLKAIAGKEKLAVDDEALALIAEHGDGSLRDSVGLLDQAANFGTQVSADTIYDLLGMPPHALIEELLTVLKSGNPAKVMGQLKSLLDQGYSAPVIANELSSLIRQQLLNNNAPLGANSYTLLARLIDVPAANNSIRLLEIVLLENMPHAYTVNPDVIVSHETVIAPKVEAQKPKAHHSDPGEDEEKPKKNESEKTKEKTEKQPEKITKPTVGSIDQQTWDEVLNLLKSNYNTLYGLARMAQVDFTDPKVIKLKFAFAFHQKRVNDPKNSQLITDAVKQVTGNELKLVSSVDPELLKAKRPAAKSEEPESTEDLESINSIFGGGELLAE